MASLDQLSPFILTSCQRFSLIEANQRGLLTYSVHVNLPDKKAKWTTVRSAGVKGRNSESKEIQKDTAICPHCCLFSRSPGKSRDQG